MKSQYITAANGLLRLCRRDANNINQPVDNNRKASRQRDNNSY